MKRKNGKLVLLRDNRHDAFATTLPKASQLKEELRLARRGECLIPRNDRDGPCSQTLNNSHLVGESHLRPIAVNGHVYAEWDTTDITNITKDWMLHGSTPMNNPYNISIGKWEPSNINIKKCTRRIACTKHDGPVFEAIDAAKLNTKLPEHQFMLGFRAVVGTLALYESVLDFLRFLDRPEAVQFWKQLGQWDEMKQGLANREQAVQARTEELWWLTEQWQRTYCDRDERGARVVTSVECFVPSIRVACSSIYRATGKPQFTLTIIPSHDGNKAIAIVSTLQGTAWWAPLTRRLLKLRAENICSEVVGLLEREPEAAVIQLAQRTHHFLISKNDYDNDEIISGGGRERIEKAMAEIAEQT